MQDLAPLQQLSDWLKDKEYYSNSSLSVFLACRRKSFYEKELNLSSPRPSPNADFGSSVHAGLAALYKTWDATAMLAAFSATWDKYLGWLPQEKLEKRLSKANGEDLLLDYIRYYKNDPLKAEPEMVEVGTVVEIKPPDGDPFLYVTRQDLICAKPGSNLLFPTDHKTTKSLTPNYFTQFTPDRQITSYIYSLQRILGPQAARSATINALLVSNTQRVFARQDIIRVPQDLVEWESETCQIVSDIRAARKTGHWYQNTKECLSYGQCPFREICTTHMNQSVIGNFPKRDRSDPLHFNG